MSKAKQQTQTRQSDTQHNPVTLMPMTVGDSNSAMVDDWQQQGAGVSDTPTILALAGGPQANTGGNPGGIGAPSPLLALANNNESGSGTAGASALASQKKAKQTPQALKPISSKPGVAPPDPAAAITTLRVLKVSYPTHSAEFDKLIDFLKSADQASRLIEHTQAKYLNNDTNGKDKAGYKQEADEQYQNREKRAENGKTQRGSGKMLDFFGLDTHEGRACGRTWGDWIAWGTGGIFSSRITNEHHRKLFLNEVMPAVFKWAVPAMQARNAATLRIFKNEAGQNSTGNLSGSMAPSIQLFRALVTEIAARVPTSSSFDTTRFGKQLGQINSSNAKINGQMINNELRGRSGQTYGDMDKNKSTWGSDVFERGLVKFRSMSNQALQTLLVESMQFNVPNLTAAQKSNVLAGLGLKLSTITRTP